MYLQCTRQVYGGYIVHFLAMYLQCTGPVHHPLPPVSSDEEMIVEPLDVPEQFCLVLIEDKVVDDSEEEDSDDKVWEITREEFKDEVVDTQGKSPKL